MDPILYPDKEVFPSDGKSDLGMSLDPYFVHQYSFALMHKTSHSNDFYLILPIGSYENISV